MGKSKIAKVPKDFYDKICIIGEKFDIPNTEAFKIHEKMLRLEFNVVKKKKLKGNGKNIWEVEF